jgi:hypothetical protein
MDNEKKPHKVPSRTPCNSITKNSLSALLLGVIGSPVFKFFRNGNAGAGAQTIRSGFYHSSGLFKGTDSTGGFYFNPGTACAPHEAYRLCRSAARAKAG